MRAAFLILFVLRSNFLLSKKTIGIFFFLRSPFLRSGKFLPSSWNKSASPKPARREYVLRSFFLRSGKLIRTTSFLRSPLRRSMFLFSPLGIISHFLFPPFIKNIYFRNCLKPAVFKKATPNPYWNYFENNLRNLRLLKLITECNLKRTILSLIFYIIYCFFTPGIKISNIYLPIFLSVSSPKGYTVSIYIQYISKTHLFIK